MNEINFLMSNGRYKVYGEVLEALFKTKYVTKMGVIYWSNTFEQWVFRPRASISHFELKTLAQIVCQLDMLNNPEIKEK